MRQGFEERVLSHDKQLVRIDTILNRVAENQDKMSVSMDKFTTSITKFVAMQEANHESFKRVHTRLDEVDIYIKEVNEASVGRKQDIDTKLNEIDLLFVMFKYPKLLLLSVVGLYAFAISDVREVIISFMKFI